MTDAREDVLRSTQMKILTTVLAKRRIGSEVTGVAETCVEWVQRVIREVRELMAGQGGPEWVEVHWDIPRTWSARLHDMGTRKGCPDEYSSGSLTAEDREGALAPGGWSNCMNEFFGTLLRARVWHVLSVLVLILIRSFVEHLFYSFRSEAVESLFFHGM